MTPAKGRALGRLLVAATAASADPERGRSQVAEAVREAPVRFLPQAAVIHRVSGTVHRGLGDVDGVPRQIRHALVQARQAAALQHMVTTGALGQIGRSFDDAGLRWLVMKGPVLAAHLYPDVGDRAYGDIDLLVHGADFGAAMELLEGFGYRHDIHNWALAEEMVAGAVGMSGGATHADLHWHLHYSHEDRRQFDLNPTEMIERSRRIDISGLSVPTFDAVDTLLTLGFHAARSGGHRLIWLKDIERSLAVDAPDLDELVRRCRTFGCAAPVGLVLERSRLLLDADVPGEIIDALLPPSLRRIDALVNRVRPPVRLHERGTLARWLSRSARESPFASVSALPERSLRTARRRLRPPAINETDDPEEKASFLRTVVEATGGPQ